MRADQIANPEARPGGPGLKLFRRSHESLLHDFLEFERQQLPSQVVEQRLMANATRLIQEYDTAAVVTGKQRLGDKDKKEFYTCVRGLLGGGALTPLLERDDVENIHILGYDGVILSLADGRRIPGPPVASSDEELVMMIRHLAATAGHTSRRFDTASPILDLRLESGHRMFAITAVAERTSVVIRRHRMLQASLEMLEGKGTITPEMRLVLQSAVRPPNPCNMLVVGGTGAGKTTLLRSLLSEVPQSELLVTIEDTLELHLGESGLHERTLALETRTANTEGTGEISMYDLAKAALRMSPDRVIVGEVRGGEVMQLLQAMGIGNDGSIGTIHAGSTKAAVNKILIYAQRSPDAPTPDSVMREIAQVLHMLVYIKKLPDGRRAITSILEITGYEDGRVITSETFAPGPDGVGTYVKPFEPDGETLARLKISGFDPDMLGEPWQRKKQGKPSKTEPDELSESAHQPAQPEPAQPQYQPPEPAQPQYQPPQPQYQPPQPAQPQYQPPQPPQPQYQPPQPAQPQPPQYQPQPQPPQPGKRTLPAPPWLEQDLILSAQPKKPSKLNGARAVMSPMQNYAVSQHYSGTTDSDSGTEPDPSSTDEHQVSDHIPRQLPDS